MHKKLLILVILIFFSCNLSKSEQNNQTSELDTQKIKEYQKNESQTNIQFSNEIKALKFNSKKYYYYPKHNSHFRYRQSTPRHNYLKNRKTKWWKHYYQ
ncbi:hypothetical protein [Borreliella bavariensis]|uniref:hypothetical protein n=1 Tax=Borreliella bavariensis TaxID=664662 RepID=UPI001F43D4F9|nr:hypothetical protein [Borreliella bavariensis]